MPDNPYQPNRSLLTPEEIQTLFGGPAQQEQPEPLHVRTPRPGMLPHAGALATRLLGGLASGVAGVEPGLGTAIAAGIGGAGETAAQWMESADPIDKTTVALESGLSAIPMGKIVKRLSIGGNLVKQTLANMTRNAALNEVGNIARRKVAGEGILPETKEQALGDAAGIVLGGLTGRLGSRIINPRVESMLEREAAAEALRNSNDPLEKLAHTAVDLNQTSVGSNAGKLVHATEDASEPRVVVPVTTEGRPTMVPRTRGLRIGKPTEGMNPELAVTGHTLTGEELAAKQLHPMGGAYSEEAAAPLAPGIEEKQNAIMDKPSKIKRELLDSDGVARKPQAVQQGLDEAIKKAHDMAEVQRAARRAESAEAAKLAQFEQKADVEDVKARMGGTDIGTIAREKAKAQTAMVEDAARQEAENLNARDKAIAQDNEQHAKNLNASDAAVQADAEQQARNLNAREQVIAKDNEQQARNLNARDEAIAADNQQHAINLEANAAAQKLKDEMHGLEPGPTSITETVTAPTPKGPGKRTLRRTFTEPKEEEGATSAKPKPVKPARGAMPVAAKPQTPPAAPVTPLTPEAPPPAAVAPVTPKPPAPSGNGGAAPNTNYEVRKQGNGVWGVIEKSTNRVAGYAKSPEKADALMQRIIAKGNGKPPEAPPQAPVAAKPPAPKPNGGAPAAAPVAKGEAPVRPETVSPEFMSKREIDAVTREDVKNWTPNELAQAQRKWAKDKRLQAIIADELASKNGQKPPTAPQTEGNGKVAPKAPEASTEAPKAAEGQSTAKPKAKVVKVSSDGRFGIVQRTEDGRFQVIDKAKKAILSQHEDLKDAEAHFNDLEAMVQRDKAKTGDYKPDPNRGPREQGGAVVIAQSPEPKPEAPKTVAEPEKALLDKSQTEPAKPESTPITRDEFLAKVGDPKETIAKADNLESEAQRLWDSIKGELYLRRKDGKVKGLNPKASAEAKQAQNTHGQMLREASDLRRLASRQKMAHEDPHSHTRPDTVQQWGMGPERLAKTESPKYTDADIAAEVKTWDDGELRRFIAKEKVSDPIRKAAINELNERLKAKTATPANPNKGFEGPDREPTTSAESVKTAEGAKPVLDEAAAKAEYDRVVAETKAKMKPTTTPATVELSGAGSGKAVKTKILETLQDYKKKVEAAEETAGIDEKGNKTYGTEPPLPLELKVGDTTYRIKPEQVDKAIERFGSGEADSAFKGLIVGDKVKRPKGNEIPSGGTFGAQKPIIVSAEDAKALGLDTLPYGDNIKAHGELVGPTAAKGPFIAKDAVTVRKIDPNDIPADANYHIYRKNPDETVSVLIGDESALKKVIAAIRENGGSKYEVHTIPEDSKITVKGAVEKMLKDGKKVTVGLAEDKASFDPLSPEPPTGGGAKPAKKGLRVGATERPTAGPTEGVAMDKPKTPKAAAPTTKDGSTKADLLDRHGLDKNMGTVDVAMERQKAADDYFMLQEKYKQDKSPETYTQMRAAGKKFGELNAATILAAKEEGVEAPALPPAAPAKMQAPKGKGPTSEDIGKLAPDKQEAAIKAEIEKFKKTAKGKKQRGAIETQLVTRLGLGVAGAAIGAKTTPDQPLVGAIIGGAVGLSGPAVFRALASHIRTLPEGSAGRMQSEKALARYGTEMLVGFAKAVPDYFRFSWLANIPNLMMNSWVGPWGAGIMSGLERAVGGDERGMPILKDFLNPKNFPKEWAGRGLREADRLVLDPNERGEVTTVRNRIITAPARGMTAGDVASREMQMRNGLTEQQAREVTLTSEPNAKINKGIGNLRRTGGPLGELMVAFYRTNANQIEQSLLRTPYGIHLRKVWDLAPVSTRMAAAQWGISGTVAGGSFVLGTQVSPEWSPFVLKFLTNFFGPYGATASVAFMSGQVYGKKEDMPESVLGGVKRFIQRGTPLPSADFFFSVLNMLESAYKEHKFNPPYGTFPPPLSSKQVVSIPTLERFAAGDPEWLRPTKDEHSVLVPFTKNPELKPKPRTDLEREREEMRNDLRELREDRQLRDDRRRRRQERRDALR